MPFLNSDYAYFCSLMKIVFTGNYDPDYNRTQVLLKGLRSLPDIELIERPFSKGVPDKSELDRADFVFLPSFTHADVQKVKSMTNSVVVFDPLISKYLTKVFDYKQVWRYSPRAFKNYRKDQVPMHSADLVLADTQEHANYFCKTFKLDSTKVRVLPIGADTDEFVPVPLKQNPDIFRVGFYGGFIPLQGTKVILDAAQILKEHQDIEFELLGDGFEFEKMKKYASSLELTNVNMPGWMEQYKLASALNNYDLCLGIFGHTPKADLVIPNKIYHYAAKGIPLISKDSAAMRELFSHRKNAYLTEAKAEDLSQAILELKSDWELRSSIAQNAKSLIETTLNHKKIAEKFVGILSDFPS